MRALATFIFSMLALALLIHLLISGAVGDSDSAVPSVAESPEDPSGPVELQALPIRRPSPTEESPREEFSTKPDSESSPRGPRATTGTIRGFLRDQLEEPLSAGEILLAGERDREPRSRLVSTEGAFSFGGVPPGTYQLRVREGSLPPGYLPPWNQEQTAACTSHPSWAHRGFYATEVSLSAGQEVEVNLYASLSSSAFGRVVGPEGEGVPGVWVRLQSAVRGLDGLCADTLERSDEDGWFRITGLYPGTYRTQPLLGKAPPAYREMSMPLPVRIEVRGGGEYDLGTLQVGAGKHQVTGQVLSEWDGSPVAGLPVLCSLGEPVADGERPHTWNSRLAVTTTDKDGRFVLEALPQAQVNILVAPEGYLPGTEIGSNTLGRPAPLVQRFLSAPTTALPPIRVWTSRPFFLKGRVELDEEWASANGAQLKHLSLTVTCPEIESFYPRQVAIDRETGAFQWACETPHPRLVFQLESRRPRGGASREVSVLPEPDLALDPFVIPFP